MSHEPTLTNADDARLIDLIRSARDRLVFIGPGISEPVAEAIHSRWQDLGPNAVNVILDVDPEVCRLGYGTLEGLKRLTKTAAAMGTMVCQQPGIRIGLLIADEKMLFYSPAPLLIEAGSTHPQRPNAVLLDRVPQELARDVGAGEGGLKDRVIGLDEVSPETLRRTEEDLKANPPAKFDLARKVRVYTHKFHFVELKMSGIHISRRKVNIPNYLMGLDGDAKVASQFHAHFNLVSDIGLEVELDDGTVLNEKVLHEQKQQIVRDYLIQLTGFGWIVRMTNKAKLEGAVEALQNNINTFRDGITERLEEAMQVNILALTNALFPAVREHVPQSYIKEMGPYISDHALRARLEDDIRRAFGDADSLLGEMEVYIFYKNITPESLNDETFLEVARKALPGVVELHEEHEAVEADLFGCMARQEELL